MSRVLILILLTAFSCYGQRNPKSFTSLTEMAATDTGDPNISALVNGSEYKWIIPNSEAADGVTIIESTHPTRRPGRWIRTYDGGVSGDTPPWQENAAGLVSLRHPTNLVTEVGTNGVFRLNLNDTDYLTVQPFSTTGWEFTNSGSRQFHFRNKVEVQTNITFNGTTPVIIRGGATYGNARGNSALDVQTSGGIASMVASGNNSVAVGIGNTASGLNSVAIGNFSSATAASSIAVGATTSSGGVAFGSGGSASNGGMMYGINSTASANGAYVAGHGATADVAFTGNFAFPIMNKNSSPTRGGTNSLSDGTNTDIRHYSGVEVVLMSQEIDLEATQDYTNALPSNVHFYPNEAGVIVTSANTVGGQPSVSFGVPGSTEKLLAAAATTGLTAAFKRQRFATLLTSEGETTLTASVTAAATATTLLGRFYWQGLLVRDQ